MKDQQRERGDTGAYRVVNADDPEDTALSDDYPERYVAITAAERESDGHQPDLIVRCLQKARCGHNGKAGEFLASVFRTSHGVLWCSLPVVAHDALPTFEEIHGEQTVFMRSPANGMVTTAIRAGFERVWMPKGYVEVDRTEWKPSWRPNHRLLVRDLLDRDDLPHVSLRVSCSIHPACVVDPAKILGELQKAAPRARRVVGLEHCAAVPY